MTFCFALHAHSGVSMCRRDLKPSPACSSLNFEQDRVFLLYPVAIFSIRSCMGETLEMTLRVQIGVGRYLIFNPRPYGARVEY